jgi:hypothetical protein
MSVFFLVSAPAGSRPQVQLSDDLSHMTYLEHKDDGGAGLPCGDNWKPPPGAGNDKQVRRRFFRKLAPNSKVGSARLARCGMWRRAKSAFQKVRACHPPSPLPPPPLLP